MRKQLTALAISLLLSFACLHVAFAAESNGPKPVNVDSTEGLLTQRSTDNSLYSAVQATDNFELIYQDNTKTIICGYKGILPTSLVIPAGVKEIGGSAFAWSGIEHVTLPSSVATIGQGAFRGCTSLASITLPDSLSTLSIYAFDECTALKDVYCPGSRENLHLTYGGYAAPYDCWPLMYARWHFGMSGPEQDSSDRSEVSGSAGNFSKVKYHYSNGVLRIMGQGAMEDYCSRAWATYRDEITTVIVEDGVTSVQGFRDLPNLKRVSLADSVKEIGDSAFAWSGIEHVTLPATLRTISRCAFYVCQNLQSITVPTALDHLGSMAFDQCENLKDVYCPGSQSDFRIDWDGGNNWPLHNAMWHFSSTVNDPPAYNGFFDWKSPDDQDSITVGSETNYLVGYYYYDEASDSEILDQNTKGYIVTTSDSSVIEVTPSVWTDQYGQLLTIRGLNPGAATITVTNPANGHADFIEFRVVTEHSGYTFSNVPVDGSIEADKLTNFYNYSGLVVDSFQYDDIKKGEQDWYRVTMNVYNKLDHGGAVVSYDKNGRICEFALVTRHAALPGSITQSLKDLYLQTGDLFRLHKNERYYSGESITKKTEIEIDVPADGYLVVTNNAKNPVVMISNFLSITIDMALTTKDVVVSSAADFSSEYGQKQLRDVIASVIKRMLLDSADQPTSEDEFWQEAAMQAIEDELANASWDVQSFPTWLEKFQSHLVSAGVNLGEIARNTLLSFDTVAAVPESALKKVIPTGKLIDWCFAFNAVLDQSVRWDALSRSLSYGEGIYLYAPTSSSTYHSNGIEVTPLSGTESDVLIHAYLITDENKIPADNSWPGENEERCTYNITMFKNGITTQPGAPCEVRIPILDKLKTKPLSTLRVYRHEADGSLTDMKATIDGNYLVFTTDHFSFYSVVARNNASTDPSSSPSAQPAPGIVAVKGYQSGRVNSRDYYVKASGATAKYYLRSTSGKMTRVAAPGVKAGSQSYYPAAVGSSVLFPRVENGKVTCYSEFQGGMEIPRLAVQAEVFPAITGGYQTGTVNGRTYYVKVSGASMKYYLKSSSGKMTRVAAPGVTSADKTRYYPINYGGTVLFPKLVDGKLAAYTTGNGEIVLAAL